MSDLPLFRAEVEPLTKEVQVGRVWTCGGGRNAAPESCTRKEPCPPCRNRRNRRKGLTKQRKARKALGVPTGRFHGQNGNEENWRACFRAEVKAGKQVESLTARFLAAEKQSDGNRAMGDNRPFLFVAMPDGSSDGVVAMRLSSWREWIVPLLEETA